MYKQPQSHQDVEDLGGSLGQCSKQQNAVGQALGSRQLNVALHDPHRRHFQLLDCGQGCIVSEDADTWDPVRTLRCSRSKHQLACMIAHATKRRGQGGQTLRADAHMPAGELARVRQGMGAPSQLPTAAR